MSGHRRSSTASPGYGLGQRGQPPDPRFSTSRTTAANTAGTTWKDSGPGVRPSWDHEFHLDRSKLADRRSRIGGVNPLERRASTAPVPSSSSQSGVNMF